MSLRLRINLMMSGLLLVFTAVLVVTQILNTRKAVLEEITASNMVATRLFAAFIAPENTADRAMMQAFLQRLGRIRSTELTLRDGGGGIVYRSPSATYKAGRSAPQWYAELVTPGPMTRQFSLMDGELTIEANASRAVLDGWDDTLRLIVIGFLALVVVQPLILWRVGRAMRPLQSIVSGLESMERGHYHTRLPPLEGAEAGGMGRAFNQMAQAVEGSDAARQEAAEATARLRQSRELNHLVELRMEDERRQIARELHDETSQSITAIHSLAQALVRRGGEPEVAQTAAVIAQAAGHLHKAVHELIPRLRPLALDSLGLADAIQNQLDDWRLAHPQVQFECSIGDLPAQIDESVTLAAFRILQEATNNALRHGKARQIKIGLCVEGAMLCVRVDDDGVGLSADWRAHKGFGVRGMQERAAALDGSLSLDNGERGVRVLATLPMGAGA